MSISCNFFKHGQFPELRISRKMVSLKILEKLSESGDRFTAISYLQNNEERVLLQAGNRQLIQKFSEQVYRP